MKPSNVTPRRGKGIKLTGHMIVTQQSRGFHEVSRQSTHPYLYQLGETMISLKTACAAACVALLSACASVEPPQDIAGVIAKTPELSSLSALIDSANLRSALKGAGPMTVFAPTNDAIAALPAKTRQNLATNPEQLRALLTFHVIASKVMAAEVKNATVKTLNGANLPLSKAGSFVTVDDAMVVKADIGATNGVIHTIDRVVTPPPVRR